jgi:hypothetical protein
MFMASLANMQTGRENAWSEAVELNYTLALEDLPDESAIPLLKAILKTCEWRPAPSAILALWREISDPGAADTLATDMALVIRLMAKYGRDGAPHRIAPNRWPNLRDAGPPPELLTASRRVHLVVEAMGGWVAMCDEALPDYVFRAQFERLYRAAGEGEASDRVRRIALGDGPQQIGTSEARDVLAMIGGRAAA